MRVCPILCSTLVSLAMCAGVVCADEAADASAKLSAALEPKPTQEQLLKQLGSEQYDVREAASRAFLDIGLAALPLLQKQEKNADREIRFRCRRIAALIRQGVLEQQLRAFVEGAGGTDSPTLPGWRQFRLVVGDSRESRQVYAAMVRQEDRLLRSMQSGPEAANSALLSSCLKLSALAEEDESFDFRIATLLFVAGLPETEASEQTRIDIYGLCLRPGFQNAVQSGSRKVLLKKLLSRMIEQESVSRFSAYSSLTVAMVYDLAAGLAPAKRILESKKGSVAWRRDALIAVAKLGKAPARREASRKILERWLDDATVYFVGRINQRQVLTTLGDAALAGLVWLVGEAHEDYGFEYLRRQPPLVFVKGTCGFDSEDKRRRAVVKWRSRSE